MTNTFSTKTAKLIKMIFRNKYIIYYFQMRVQRNIKIIILIKQPCFTSVFNANNMHSKKCTAVC